MKIETLVNPGWSVRIDLEETELQEHDYRRQDVNRGTHERVWVRTSEKVWHAACGPGHLVEALTIFRSWATATAP